MRKITSQRKKFREEKGAPLSITCPECDHTDVEEGSIAFNSKIMDSHICSHCLTEFKLSERKERKGI
ncbi:MAG: hypothetical protein WC302_00810 [Candidatus Paceibacterota bacterium]